MKTRLSIDTHFETYRAIIARTKNFISDDDFIVHRGDINNPVNNTEIKPILKIIFFSLINLVVGLLFLLNKRIKKTQFFIFYSKFHSRFYSLFVILFENSNKTLILFVFVIRRINEIYS
jgi:hypothetical protein